MTSVLEGPNDWLLLRAALEESKDGYCTGADSINLTEFTEQAGGLRGSSYPNLLEISILF